MRVVDFIGLIVIQCDCGQKFVIDVAGIQSGGMCCPCSCGKGTTGRRGATLQMTFVDVHTNTDKELATRYAVPMGQIRM